MTGTAPLDATFDILVIGGGIVGLASAWRLQQRFGNLRIAVLEKEPSLALHQSGRNSGVIHAGIYYAPGSLKARFCRAGLSATIAFCEANAIPILKCGKVIVATNESEAARLAGLYDNALGNGVAIERLTRAALRERLPDIRGVAALWSPATAAVDFRSVALAMARRFEELGGHIVTGTAVTGWQERHHQVVLQTSAGAYGGRFAVCCAGLHAETLARMAGLRPDFRIIPFRGEFYRLPPVKAASLAHHVYPVPAPDMPFLGIHVTRQAGGGHIVGPNAVLALSREGYRWRDVERRALAGAFSYPGFWRMLARYPGASAVELLTSASRAAYVARIRRYLPALTAADLTYHPAGVRAQAVLKDGRLLHDFAVLDGACSLHVCNAPSPAATSALPIADWVSQRVADRLAG